MNKVILLMILFLALSSAYAEVAIDAETGGVSINTSNTERFYVDSTGNVYIRSGNLYVMNSTDSTTNGSIFMGRTSGTPESIRFDTSEGTAGKFVFSKPILVPGSSPAITFYDINEPENQSKYKSLIYDPVNLTIRAGDSFVATFGDESGAPRPGKTFFQIGQRKLDTPPGGGAFIGANTPNSFVGDLMQLQVNNNPRFRVTYFGDVIIRSGIMTTNAPIINTEQTWNDGGTSFNAWDLNIINTASAAGSKLLDLKVGGTSQFYVNRDGHTNITGDVYAYRVCDETGSNCKDISSGWATTSGDIEAAIYDTGNDLDSIGNAWTVIASSGTNDINFDSNTFVVDTGNNRVGIGVASPNSQLQLNHDTSTLTTETDYAFSIKPDDTIELAIGSSTTGGYSFIQSFDPGTAWSGKPLVLMPNNGRVGIGTINPGAILEITHGDNKLAIFNSTDDAARIQVSDDDTTGYFNVKDSVVSISQSTGLGVGVNIDASGSVGIGLENPSDALAVSGSANITQTVYATQICDEAGGNCKDVSTGWAAGGTGNSSTEIESVIYDTGNDLDSIGNAWTVTASSGTNDINFDSDTFVVDTSTNNVGIGESSPDATLEIAGNLSVNGYRTVLFENTTSWSSGSPPAVFISLGEFMYTGGPIHILASDSGCGMGGNAEYIIFSTYNSDPDEDIRVYSLGDTDEFPNSEDDYTLYINKTASNRFRVGIQHAGGCTGPNSKNLKIKVIAADYEPFDTEYDTDAYTALTTRKYIYANETGNANIPNDLLVAGGDVFFESTYTNGMSITADTGNTYLQFLDGGSALGTLHGSIGIDSSYSNARSNLATLGANSLSVSGNADFAGTVDVGGITEGSSNTLSNDISGSAADVSCTNCLTATEVQSSDIAYDLSCSDCIGGTEIDESALSGVDADTLGGVDADDYTREDLTMLGKTGNVAIDGATDTATEWAAVPVGYSRMIQSSVGIAGGAPVDNHGYFTKVANRDTGGGWGGLWVGYSTGENYVGRTSTSSSFASWEHIWTNASDGSGSGLDADTLDTISSGSFLRSDTADTMSTGEDVTSLKIIKAVNSPDEPAVLMIATDADAQDDMAFEIRGNPTGTAVDTSTTMSSADTTFAIFADGTTAIGYNSLGTAYTPPNSALLAVNGDVTVAGNQIYGGTALDLYADGSNSALNLADSDGGASNFHFFYDTTDDIYMSYGTSGQIHWRSGTTERMNLDASGNLQMDGNLEVNGNLNMDDGHINYVRELELQDWDDNTGGGDDTVRLLRRDGFWMFYNGPIAAGGWGDGSAPTGWSTGDIIANDDISSGGGIRVGGIGDPGTWELYVNGQGYVSDYLRADGGLTTDSTDPGANRLRVGDYAVILGGAHIGGTSDPGTDNLVVDGTATIGPGQTSIGDSSGDSNLKITTSSSQYPDVIFSTGTNYNWYWTMDNQASGSNMRLLKFDGSVFTYSINCRFSDAKCQFTAGTFDYAESFPKLESEYIEKGQILTTTIYNNNVTATSSIREYDPTIVGVRSTYAGYTIGPWGDDHNVEVALAGRAPVLLTNINGMPKINDAVATSLLPGYGMKSTEPGTIVGKLLQEVEWNENNCPLVESIENIEWPEDNMNELKACFSVPISSLDDRVQQQLYKSGFESDHIYIGKIVAFINVEYWEPENHEVAQDNTIENLKYINEEQQQKIQELESKVELLNRQAEELEMLKQRIELLEESQ